MPRKRNQLGTEQITIAATPQVAAYLDVLVGTGLYGKNRAEAASQLIRDAILQGLGAEAIRDRLNEALGRAFQE